MGNGDRLEPGWLTQAAGAAAGAGLGLASPSTAGVLLGAVLPVAVVTAARLDNRAHELRVQRAAQTLARAAEELNVELEQVEEAVVDRPVLTELLARVLAASANAATAQEKVDALGVVLAQGLRDDAKLDEAFVLAAALHDIEAPHLRVLAAMAIVVNHGGGRFEWGDPLPRFHRGDRTYDEVASAAGGELVAPAIVSALQRHGLLVAGQDRADEMHLMVGAEGTAPVEPTYKISGLGVACLRLLLPDVPTERRKSS